jgi:predicted deacylase
MSELEIGGTTIERGDRIAFSLPVPGVDEQHWPPVVAIRGRETGPFVAITAGVHGGEYNGIEAARRLARALRPSTVRGTVVVVPLANAPSFYGRSHNGSPLDHKNLNRVFPGDAGGTATDRIAAALAGILRRADAVLDLHGADPMEDLHPFTMVPDHAVPQSEALARAFGVRPILRGSSPGSTVDWLAAQGVPAILVEAGAFGHVNESAVRLHHDGCLRVLRHLGVLRGPKPAPLALPWQRMIWVGSPRTGFFYTRVRAGQTVRKGALLGEVRDPRTDDAERITSPVAGKVLFVKKSMATSKSNSLYGIAAPEPASRPSAAPRAKPATTTPRGTTHGSRRGRGPR